MHFGWLLFHWYIEQNEWEKNLIFYISPSKFHNNISVWNGELMWHCIGNTMKYTVFIDQLMYRKYTWNFVTNGLWNKSHFYLYITYKRWKKTTKKLKLLLQIMNFLTKKLNSARCNAKVFGIFIFWTNIVCNFRLHSQFVPQHTAPKTLYSTFNQNKSKQQQQYMDSTSSSVFVASRSNNPYVTYIYNTYI